MVQSFFVFVPKTKKKNKTKNDLIIRVVTVEVKSKANVHSCLNVITLENTGRIITD